jgi:hypothetical protein
MDPGYMYLPFVALKSRLFRKNLLKKIFADPLEDDSVNKHEASGFSLSSNDHYLTSSH